MRRGVEVVTPPELKRLGGLVGDLARAVLEAEGVRGAVVVAFVDEGYITGLNGRFRNLTEPTDVLSFRQADSDVDWPGPSRKGSPDLGEVAVCLEVVRRYAQEEGGDLGTRLGWTLVHGILHLLGYDHENDDGMNRMHEREQTLLQMLERRVKALSAAVGRMGSV